MNTIVKSPARIKAEESVYALLDAFDTSRYNSDQYRKLFNGMSNLEFKTYMQNLSTEQQYISMEIDTATKKLTLDKMFKIASSLGVKTHKYVMYRENTSSDGKECSITPYPSLILYIPVKRLQQFISKKNSASGNTDKINPLTGTVTSESKSASINDTQSFGLLVTGQRNTLKEFMGPRADDDRSKNQMLHTIEEKGEVFLKDLSIVPSNKQSLQTMKVFMRAVGIEVKVT